MRKPRYKYVEKLVGRITSSSQPNNAEFDYYGHLVTVSSGCADYFAVTVYRTTDRYSGEVADFSFEYAWTPSLFVEFAESDEMEAAIIQGFRNIYGKRLSVEIEKSE